MKVTNVEASRVCARCERVPLDAGEAPLVKGKGPAAKEVAEIMERLRREAVADAAEEADRWTDSDEDDGDGGKDDDDDDPWRFDMGGLRVRVHTISSRTRFR